MVIGQSYNYKKIWSPFSYALDYWHSMFAEIKYLWAPDYLFQYLNETGIICKHTLSHAFILHLYRMFQLADHEITLFPRFFARNCCLISFVTESLNVVHGNAYNIST